MNGAGAAGAGEAPAGRANVIGLGLIGGSLALALRARGWHVSGGDTRATQVDEALARGVVDAAGIDAGAAITFVATPVAVAAAEARRALGATTAPVTDVGGIKAAVVGAVDDPRFVGGHPMAGSEQEGLAGADATMFEGATWVLTPTADTDPAAFTAVRAVVASLGAEAVALAPEEHDALVAMVSHVPHLTAASLMAVADERAEEHASLLRLAAGGFRDMTRVASGGSAIWPDICVENGDAIVKGLDALVAQLRSVRSMVVDADRAGLLAVLERARSARRNLPRRVSRPAELAEVRVPVPDRPGVLAEVTTLASELGVDIADVEIAHSAEGDRGVVILLVDRAGAERYRGGLMARGYRPAVRSLE